MAPTVLVVAFAIGLSMGFVLQKSKLCHASMLADLFAFRALSRNGKSLLLATGLTMLGWSGIVAVRGTRGMWLPAWGWYGLIGGAIFGVGMVVAGCCMMSALYRAGSGHMQYLLTLLSSAAGYFAYGLVYPTAVDRYFTPLWGGPGATLFTATPVPAPGVAALAVSVALVGYLWFTGSSPPRRQTTVVADGGAPATGHDARLRTGLRSFWDGTVRYLTSRRQVSIRGAVTSSWDPRSGALVLAGLAILWLWLSGVWTVSGPEAGWVARAAGTVGFQPAGIAQWERSLFAGTAYRVTPNMLVLLGLGVGAVPAALASGEFEIRWPRKDVLPHAVGGGLLLGIGASLAPGCNVGNLFTGLAQLSLHGLIASLGILIGAYAGTRVLFGS